MSELRRLISDLWITTKSVTSQASADIWARRWEDIYKTISIAVSVSAVMWLIFDITPQLGLLPTVATTIFVIAFIRSGPHWVPTFSFQRTESWQHTAWARRSAYIDSLVEERTTHEHAISQEALARMYIDMYIGQELQSASHSEHPLPGGEFMGAVAPMSREPADLHANLKIAPHVDSATRSLLDQKALWSLLKLDRFRRYVRHQENLRAVSLEKDRQARKAIVRAQTQSAP